MMKKCFSWACLCGIISIVFLSLTTIISPGYAGEYDGIWSIPSDPGYFIAIRHKAGSIIVIGLDDMTLEGGEWWEVFAGPIVGNSATIRSAITDIDFAATVNFTSQNSATITIDHCYPERSCDFHGGDVFTIEKIF